MSGGEGADGADLVVIVGEGVVEGEDGGEVGLGGGVGGGGEVGAEGLGCCEAGVEVLLF